MTRTLDFMVATLLGGGVLFMCGDALVAMVRLWNESPMYSYAFTVPVIGLVILWSRRDEFKHRRLQPARLVALPVFAAGLTLFVIGEVGAIQLLQQFAFLLAIVGIVLFLFGIEYFKVALPALMYLLFMIPFWDAFTEPLHWPFQQNSARLGISLLHAIGVPAHREGTVIALPNVTIEVARACSGVNYLVAVLALALPLSYLRLNSMWRRLVLIASAMLIAALANGLRVALIGALAYYEVGSPLHGPFHVLHGLFVAGIGYVALFAGLGLLQNHDNGAPSAASQSESAGPRRWRVVDAIVLAAAFWVTATVGVAPQSTRVALTQPLDELPSQLGDWSMVPRIAEVPADATNPWAAADQSLRRRYQVADGSKATVDVWYFEVQQQNREMVNFKSAALHRSASPRVIALPEGGALKANLIRWPERGEIGLFWYDISGVAESDQYVAKLRSLWGALIDGRTNGAAVMLKGAVPAGREDQAIAALEGLAVKLQERLVRHWPAARTKAT